MTKTKQNTKTQTIFYKTPHINLKIEQQESHKNLDEIMGSGRVALYMGSVLEFQGYYQNIKKININYP